MQKNWRELIKPKKLEVDRSTLTETYGKFVAEPLERGFGLTIGNSLRRILLSSLQGAAVTSVKIDGVLHEFSNISGVKEDVSDIILNLKKVRFRLEGDYPKTVTISAKGEGVIKAGDIICDSTVTVFNPDQHIATLSADGAIEAEITVDMGKGYVPAEAHSEELPVGAIAVDAMHQPVKRVNFDITNARVGQRTDYDKLSMEVYTSGDINPQDAVAIAAKILKEQLTLFITFDEEEEDEVEEVVVSDTQEFNENLYKTVDELELSVRSANCLKNANIKFIGEMVQKTEQEMLRTKNFGRKSLNEIKEILHRMGLDFGEHLEGFPTRQDLDSMVVERKESV